MGRSKIVATILCCLAIAGCSRARPAESYRLLSWQGTSGEWYFFLSLDTGKRRPTAKEVFRSGAAFRGVDQLKRALRGMRNAEVAWCAERLCLSADARPGERLRMPPAPMVDEVMTFGAQQGVRITTAHTYPQALLYSWRQGEDWDFALFSRIVGRVSVQELFHGNGVVHGIDELQREMVELPQEMEIFWCGAQSCLGPWVHAQDGDQLAMPGPQITERVIRMAGERRVRISEAVAQTWVLHSWQESNGEWRFFYFPGVISRTPTEEEIFGSDELMYGVEELKRSLAGLPSGSVVYWWGKARGVSQRISIPPADVVAEMRRVCAEHQVKLTVDGGPVENRPPKENGSK